MKCIRTIIDSLSSIWIITHVSQHSPVISSCGRLLGSQCVVGGVGHDYIMDGLTAHQSPFINVRPCVFTGLLNMEYIYMHVFLQVNTHLFRFRCFLCFLCLLFNSIRPFTSFIHSFISLFIYLLIDWLIDSLIHPLIHPLFCAESCYAVCECSWRSGCVCV